jgi:hypothetical protein
VPLVGLEEARYRQIYRRVRKHFQLLHSPDLTHQWLSTGIRVQLCHFLDPDDGIHESFQGAMTVSKCALTVSPCRRGSHQHWAPAGAGRSTLTAVGGCPCSSVLYRELLEPVQLPRSLRGLAQPSGGPLAQRHRRQAAVRVRRGVKPRQGRVANDGMSCARCCRHDHRGAEQGEQARRARARQKDGPLRPWPTTPAASASRPKVSLAPRAPSGQCSHASQGAHSAMAPGLGLGLAASSRQVVQRHPSYRQSAQHIVGTYARSIPRAARRTMPSPSSARRNACSKSATQ